ncbi:membrane protein [Microlunatus endophyticus]|uniref:Membrane protein n=1 Tax=Microlunatus endophyticus TaxID=1716077 RepID=A0A917W2K5_9ACTN|nr:glycosyltransferase family 87 protein [Microlunatus endophyticus]GGL55705.1 membrane protein [Microlunatus endophyticus]
MPNSRPEKDVSSQPSTAQPAVSAGPTATRRGGVPVVVTWVVTRAIMVLLAATVENVATGDVTYYWRKIAALGEVGLSQTLNEYPTPVVWMLSIPYGIGAGTHHGYQAAFIGLMMALDAVFAYALWRAAGRRRDAGLTFWVWFVFLMGPLCYLRFDLVPAVLAGSAVLLCRRRPAITGVLTGVAAAIKLWPALLIFPFTAARRGRRNTLLGFAVAGVGLAVVSLITGGLPRLVSPLTWQSDRGLQIESVWSTALMVLRIAHPRTWVVGMSRYQAFEVFGPGVGAWLVISTVATLVGLVIMIMLYARGYRTPNPTSGTIGVMILATIAIMTITNKTLSPQYLVWLGGPMAAMLIMRSRDVRGRPTIFSRFAIQLLVLALITHLVYPLTYTGLYEAPHGRMFVLSTILLLIRNLCLLVFTIAITAVAWRATGRRPDPDVLGSVRLP